MLFDGEMCPAAKAISVKDDKRVRVLIVGNSITYHRPAVIEGIIWEGAWGMAATAESEDYAHKIIAKANASDYKTEIKIGNALGFEQLEVTSPRELAAYQEFNPDILVIALGANVGDRTDSFLPYYEQFIKDIGAEKNIVVSTLWCSDEFRAGAWTMADNNGWEKTDCYTDSTPAVGADGFYGWSSTGYFGNNSIGWHPGNGAMTQYATQIWNEDLSGAVAAVAATK